MPRQRKPEPQVVSTICSLCGLDWERHGAEPTSETCIELLLGEVRSLNAQLAARPIVQPIGYPLPVPYPRTYPVPYYRSPWWWNNSGTTITTAYNTTANTPRLSSAVPFALNASN